MFDAIFAYGRGRRQAPPRSRLRLRLRLRIVARSEDLHVAKKLCKKIENYKDKVDTIRNTAQRRSIGEQKFRADHLDRSSFNSPTTAKNANSL